MPTVYFYEPTPLTPLPRLRHLKHPLQQRHRQMVEAPRRHAGGQEDA